MGMEGKKIVQSVPNFSEGRNKTIIEKIIAPFQNKEDVTLLDYQADPNHNRLVVTIVGAIETIAEPILESVCVAVSLIDLRDHEGAHPRMGAVDVVPFIPLGKSLMEDVIALSRQVGAEIANRCGVPVFLYEKSATAPHRENLAAIRKGEFEAMGEKMTDRLWIPDFGPHQPHPSAGVTAVGGRMPLIAFNVTLDTEDEGISAVIAKKIRFSGGGFRYCKAISVALKEKKQVQVSMNLTDFKKTAIQNVFEMIASEAMRYGVRIAASEIVGLAPMEALLDVAAHALKIPHLSTDQILEYRLIDT